MHTLVRMTPLQPRRSTLILWIVTLIVGTLVFHSLSAPAARAANGVLLGVYFGNQGWAMDQVQAMERWQAKRHAIVNLFTNWCDQTAAMDNLFTQQVPNIWNNRNVPLITWEPFLCSPSGTPVDIEVRAAAGEYDDYLQRWAARLTHFLAGPDTIYGNGDDRRVYLRVGHEMNGDWYPWSAVVGDNTPADYVDMWRHVRAIFDAEGLDETHVQWVWCVNHEDIGGVSAEQYYPGDDAVDWVVVDGYNWGTSQTWSSWKTPAQVYAPMFKRLRSLGKPLGITEGASSTATSSGVSTSAKATWITDFFRYASANDIRMVVWFNQDKETDWAVFGGAQGDTSFQDNGTTYRTYKTYRAAVAAPQFVSSNKTNPQLLSDAQFSGR